MSTIDVLTPDEVRSILRRQEVQAQIAEPDFDSDNHNDVVERTAESWQNVSHSENNSDDKTKEFEPFFFRGLEDITKKGTEWVAKAAEKIGLKEVAQNVRGAGASVLKAEHAVGTRTEAVIHIAGHAVSVSGDYLTDLARHESHNDPFARAPTSSATGLHQFLDQTWLGTVSKHGAQAGGELASAASHIHFDGKKYVVDSGLRQSVLDLRLNPTLSTTMARALTQDNAAYLEHAGIANPTNPELYLAHLLGPNKAVKFIHAFRDDPNGIAKNMLPDEAATNHGVFYHGGQPRTIAGVVNYLAADFIPTSTALDRSQVQLATNEPSRHNPPVAPHGHATTTVANG